MTFYLGNWYKSLSPSWTKQGPVETILDKRMTAAAHEDMARHHWHLAQAEKTWRADLLLALGDRTNNLLELPGSLKEAAKAKRSLGAVLAMSWTASVERQQAHVAAAKQHLRYKQVKEARLLKILEGNFTTVQTRV